MSNSNGYKPQPFKDLTPVVPGLVYIGQMTIVAGPPSSGKSRMLAKTCLGLARGEAGWWGRSKALDILYCAERDWAFTCTQLRAMGITQSVIPDNLRFFCLGDLTKSEHASFELNPLTFITDNHCHHFDPKLVILDTLFHFYPSPVDTRAMKPDLNNYNYNRRQLHLMKTWAAERSCGILASHHTPKMREGAQYGDPLDRVMGSQAILGAMVATVVLERPSSLANDYVRLYFNSHTERMPLMRHFSLDDFHEVPEEEVNAIGSARDLGKAQTQIVKFLSNEFQFYSEIATLVTPATGIAKPNVYRALDALGRTNEIITSVDGLGNKMARLRVPS